MIQPTVARRRTSTPTDRRGQPRVVATFVCTAALALACVPPGDATAASPPGYRPHTSLSAADRGRPQAGFRIRPTERAAGGWIGGRVLGGDVVYRIEPRAHDRRSRYQSTIAVDHLDGPRQPAPRAVARAAWVLSKYGAYDQDIQAAAVDAVTYHLLVGGRWRIGRRAGSARIRQTGPDRRYVRSYARIMLAKSQEQAGPYRVSLDAGAPAAASTSARVSASVVATHTAAPLSEVPVTFQAPGSEPVTAYTDRVGTAEVFLPVLVGATHVTATVASVPSWRLQVRRAARRGASDVAVAGTKTTLTSSGLLEGVGEQSVSIAATAPVTLTSEPLGATVSLSGGSGARDVRIRLHGPSATAADACGAVARLDTATTWAEGSHPVPAFTPSSTGSGYYAWSVNAGANRYTNAAVACGPPVRVQRQGTLTNLSWTPFDATSGSLKVTLGGFDRAENHRLTFELFGPFPAGQPGRCDAAAAAASDFSVDGNGSPTSGLFTVQTGYTYAARARLAEGEFVRGAAGGCLVFGS